jgi:hypothetical protein
MLAAVLLTTAAAAEAFDPMFPIADPLMTVPDLIDQGVALPGAGHPHA